MHFSNRAGVGILFCVSVLACAGASASLGATIHVSPNGDDAKDGLDWTTAKRTVQAGLNAAAPGEQVWVAAGTYVENITLKLDVALYGGFAGNETDLSQRNWTANPTILDGNKAGSVVTSPEGATTATRIDGFTIRKGSGTLVGSSRYGGGIYCSDSSPTIANNTVTGNSATMGGAISCDNQSRPTISNNAIVGNLASSGAGVSCASSSPTITNNTFTNNDASFGGAITCDASSSPEIANNTITGNNASYEGGGIRCHDSSPTIVSNSITANSGSDGGGIYCGGVSLVIANNTITGNVASADGGGIYCLNSPTIANNTLTGNSAAVSGGGIYCASASSPTVANTIIAFNSSGVYKTGSGTPVLRHNCAFGNLSYDYSGIADPTGTTGNIKQDPGLSDAAYGNVHIQPGSPCIDAGSDAEAGGLDVDRQPRIQGSHVDIGADESDGTTWPAGPYIIVRVSTSGDDANDGLSWASAKRTIQAGIDAAAQAGGDVWVSAGTYPERIALRPFAHAFGGFSGGETHRDQRDWVANVTVVDGQAGGSVVTVRAGVRVSTVDGFTIRNGTGRPSGSVRYGGGIYCFCSAPTISHNIIRGNSATNGGGILCTSSAWPTIANNMIMGNSAASGGGIHCESSSCPTIANNTIAANNAPSGGGICCDSSAPTIVNTIVASNSSGIRATGAGTPVLRYNCAFGNTSYDYSGIADPTGTAGNIKQAPGLSDAAYGNIHIQPGSPCVDAGSDTDAPAGGLDVDRQPRIQGSHVDIGADESDGTTWPAGPYTIVRVSPSGDDANDGLSWASAKRTVQAGFDAAAQAGGDVWVSAGTYPERIALRPFSHAFGGFSGSETRRDQREWSANVTTLDGQGSGSVVTATAGDRTSTIDGFTIRGGNAPSGGGIYCRYSSPTIANNAITGNVAASDNGGGICCDYSSPVIVNNAITGNSANGAVGDGGGIFCDHSSASIANNLITANSTTYDGGGICCDYSNVTIVNNTITGNSASQENGGGIDCYYSSPMITNNMITGNRAPLGGGIGCESSSAPTIARNTITGNVATWSGSILGGGGIYCDSSAPTIANNAITGNSATNGGGGICCSSSSPTVVNNAITGNTARDGGGISSYYSFPTITNTIIAFNSSGLYKSGSRSPTLKYNGVFGNAAYNYRNITDPTGTSGNISADPRFVRNPSDGGDGWGTGDNDDYGDLRLQAGSPCIDAGHNAAVPADTPDLDGDGNTTEPLAFDIAGHARFVDDPVAPDTGQGAPPIVDMGAYERIVGDQDDDGDVDLEDFLAFSRCFNGPNALPAATGCADADYDADADVDLEDFLAFSRCFNGPNRLPACAG